MKKVYEYSKEKISEYNLRHYIKNREKILEHQRKRYLCIFCNKNLNLSNKSKHLKCNKHKKNKLKINKRKKDGKYHE